MLFNIFQFSLPLHNPVLQFSLILFIILFAPLLLNKFKIPPLIGLIIAGAIIGPFGLNIMLRDSSIVLYGTVGLLYIMFLAGLEIDFVDFKKNTAKSLYFGFFTFIIPMTIGYFAGIHILHLNDITAILLASMFASHTLIAYPIISKYGVTRNRAVSITAGGTVITDTLALLVLAVIVGMTQGEINQEFWIRLAISITAFAFVVYVFFPIITRWFFKTVHDKISQFIFVLALLFLGAFLAELAGIEAIIGAFLAGLSLNRLIPRTSALMNRIEFVGNALFIPIFLIGVGMLINYKAFIHDLEAVKVGLIMTTAAMVSKFLAAFITQKTFSFSVDERRIIFGLSNAQAAATLAAVLVGYNIVLNQADIEAAKLLGEIIEPVRLLNDNILNGTILMILITCTYSSIVAQKGARNIALQDAASDNDVDNSAEEERLLLPISQKTNIQELLNLSISIKSKTNKNNVFALHIVDNESSPSVAKKAQKLLDASLIAASGSECQLQKLMRYDVSVANGINNVIRELQITDVILHAEDDAANDIFLGTTIDSVIQKSEVNIMVYGCKQPIATIKRNLVIIPVNAEKEVGFSFWILKVWNLAKNTGNKMVFYGSPSTLYYLKEIYKKHPIDADFHDFKHFEDFLVLAREIKNDDSLIFILSRKDSPSYIPSMNKIPSSLREYFPETNYLLYFPAHYQPGDLSNGYYNPSMLAPVEKLDDFAKYITQLFRKSV